MIKSELLLREVRLMNDPKQLHRVHTSSFIDSQEFKLYQHIQTSFPHLTKDPSLTKSKRPSLKVTCFVARRPMYFVWNVFLIIVSFYAADFCACKFLVTCDVLQILHRTKVEGSNYLNIKFASNLGQVANLRCAQVNSASYPSRDGE